MILQNGDRIVFAGDSVTDAGRARPIGEGGGLGDGFVRTIENFLNVFYPERMMRVTNMGVSGNTSKDLLARFDTDVVDLKPTYAVICIGFNDVWRQFDFPWMMGDHVLLGDYESNLRTMVKKCVGANIQPIFMTPYYMETNRNDAMRARMDEYGMKMKEIAREMGVPCIDLQPAFDQLLQYRYPASIMWDRIHPGPIGSLLIAKEFLNFVEFDFDRMKK